MSASEAGIWPHYCAECGRVFDEPFEWCPSCGEKWVDP